MTTATVHEVVLGLYEDEVRRIIGEVVGAVAVRFDLDKDEVEEAVRDKLNFELTLAPRKENFRVVECRRAPCVREERAQCCALTCKKTQCTRRVLTAKDEFCSTHLERQRFGRVD